MAIRFAAAQTAMSARMSREASREVEWLATNDNAAPGHSEATIHAALRHFAEHGLDAAREAEAQAQRAAQAGDEQAFEWWRGICRALDRRLARSLDERASVNG